MPSPQDLCEAVAKDVHTEYAPEQILCITTFQTGLMRFQSETQLHRNVRVKNILFSRGGLNLLETFIAESETILVWFYMRSPL